MRVIEMGCLKLLLNVDLGIENMQFCTVRDLLLIIFISVKLKAHEFYMSFFPHAQLWFLIEHVHMAASL